VKATLQALIVATLLLVAGSARAYVIDTDGHGHELHWSHFPVSYYIVPDGFAQGSDGELAIHQAFQTWADASDTLRYSFAGYAAQGSQANDGKNMIYFVNQGWPYDPSLAAITFRYFDTGDGHILDADIIFNGEGYPWSVGGDEFDIQNSATHEIGHLNGLGHSPDTESTMYADTRVRETSKRTLASDDLAALASLYGGVTSVATTATQQVVASSSTGTGGGGGGGCSLGGRDRQPGRPADLACVGLVLTVLSLRRWRLVRRRRGR
jgi:matrixin